jgi:hypothetical protein
MILSIISGVIFLVCVVGVIVLSFVDDEVWKG